MLYEVITPRNREQQFAFDILLNEDIQLVTLVGKAGTGKTLLALAAGLHLTADENTYSRLLVSRPVFPLGRDLGFLPGDVEEKLVITSYSIHYTKLYEPRADRFRARCGRQRRDLRRIPLPRRQRAHGSARNNFV